MITLIINIGANLGSFLFLCHYQSRVSRHCVHVTETFLPDHSLLSRFPKMSKWTMLPQLKRRPFIEELIWWFREGNCDIVVQCRVKQNAYWGEVIHRPTDFVHLTLAIFIFYRLPLTRPPPSGVTLYSWPSSLTTSSGAGSPIFPCGPWTFSWNAHANVKIWIKMS